MILTGISLGFYLTLILWKERNLHRKIERIKCYLALQTGLKSRNGIYSYIIRMCVPLCKTFACIFDFFFHFAVFKMTLMTIFLKSFHINKNNVRLDTIYLLFSIIILHNVNTVQEYIRPFQCEGDYNSDNSCNILLTFKLT